jgi:hypothetical protein
MSMNMLPWFSCALISLGMPKIMVGDHVPGAAAGQSVCGVRWDV